MLQTERRNKIISLLKEKNHIYVKELSSHFKVSEETIRRDLKNLEKHGFINKEYGGANISIPVNHEISFREREIHNLERKKAIALTAAGLIRSGDVIMFDASTTVFELAKIIPDIPVTVITNSLMIIQLLASKSSIQIISTGGILNKKNMCFHGDPADDVSEKINAGKFFFSCQGIDPVYGLSESEDETIRIKKKMLKASNERILLADSGKFEVRSLYRSFDLKEVNTIITDSLLPQNVSEMIKETGVKLLYGSS